MRTSQASRGPAAADFNVRGNNAKVCAERARSHDHDDGRRGRANGLSDPSHPSHRAVCAGRQHRLAGPRAGRLSGPRARPTGGGRQCRRRRRHHRPQPGRQSDAGRLHAGDGDAVDDDQSLHSKEHPLRPDQGFRADRAGGHQSDRAGGAQGFQDQDRARFDRDGQGQARGKSATAAPGSDRRRI